MPAMDANNVSSGSKSLRFLGFGGVARAAWGHKARPVVAAGDMPQSPSAARPVVLCPHVTEKLPSTHSS